MTSPGKTLDLDGMEAVARAATGGPWSFDPQRGGLGKCFAAQVWDTNGNSLLVVEPLREPEKASATAEFIATFDPPAVLALIQMQRELVGACLKVRSVNAKAAREGYLKPEEWGDELFACNADLSAAIAKALGEQPL